MQAAEKEMARKYDPTRAQSGEGTVFRAEKKVAEGDVICEIGKMVIPTYLPPEPEEMPIFSEYRQHQGSTGNAYPNRPTLNATRDTLTDRDYTVVRLENKYIRLLILPEIGGRVLEAYDKTSDYNFLYRHHRIKPVIVGSYGSWISGGMEFNYPFHHRPSTFLPVDFTTEMKEDGSVIVWLSEAAPSPGQYRVKGTYGICLTPDASYYETIVKLDNRTPVKHPFMWWENAAIHVNKDYQLFFPQDVGYVHHHYDRHHATFPISKGWYAVENHEEETDISRHPNTIKGNSYFAAPSRYDFFGGYDNGRDCGTVHVADHHITPGKKMFQWALEDLGDAWNNNLTDNDGEHAELMAGSYADDQPDFTYMAPYEVKRFSQFWYPIHGTGLPIFANIHGCISMDKEQKKVGLAVTKKVEYAVFEILLKENGENTVLLEEKVTLAPSESVSYEFAGEKEKRYTFRLTTAEGEIWMDYTEDIPDEIRVPEDNEGIPTPEELTTAEELTDTGLHIDQYRDPSWHGREYFERALERNPAYAPALLAMAEDALNRCAYEEGLGYIERAERALFKHSHNPYDGTIYYLKGLLQYGKGEIDEAYETLYKASWSANVIAPAMTWIAGIDGQRGAYADMRDHASMAIAKEGQHAVARAYLAIAEYQLGNKERAVKILEEILGEGKQTGAIAGAVADARGVGRWDGDKLDHLARFLYTYYTKKDMAEFYALLKSNPSQTCIDIAIDLLHAGQKKEAAAVLKGLKDSKNAVGFVPVGVYASDAVPQPVEGAEGRYGEFDRFEVKAGTPDKTALVQGSYGNTKGGEGLGNLSVMGHYILADILQQLGEKEEAEVLRSVVKGHYVVDIFPYRPEEIKVLAKAAEEDETDAVAVYLEGCILYDKLHSEEAAKCFEEAIRRDPDSYFAYRCLGAAYFSRLNRRQEALPLYKKAMELTSGNEMLLIETNFVMSHIGVDPDERLTYLLANKPEKINDELTWEIADAMTACEKYEDAVKLLKSHEFVAAECQETYLTESWTFANVAIGRLLMRDGKPEEALSYFRDAQKIQENFRAGWWDTQALYYARVHEANCLLALGRKEEARNVASKVLPFIHSNYSPYMGPESDVYVGMAMRILGDDINSRKYVSKSVMHWEDDLKGALGGNGRKATGDGRRDRKPIVTALFLTTVPDGEKEHDSEIYQALGYSRLFFNDPVGAKEYFTKSLELDPSNRKARFELSLLK